MMTYKEAITGAMTDLARDPAVVFVGYGLTKGRAGGTLAGVGARQIVEMPVAENLMTGAAIGMALAGRKPVVYFERMDFALNAADAIVNHLAAAPIISRGEFKPAVWLRCVVGNRTKPLFTGHTHTQDLSAGFAEMDDSGLVMVIGQENCSRRLAQAAAGFAEGESVLTVEYKDYL